MGVLTQVICLVLVANRYNECRGEDTEYAGDASLKWPTVGISVLVRNKAHTLPYFLSCLHKLDYPKDRLYIWIYSDYNEDNSEEILEKWTQRHGQEYKGLYLHTNASSGQQHEDELSPTHWSALHLQHVIFLREQALNFARTMWADYLFMLDADAYLTNPSTLKYLVYKEMDIVAPMLVSDGLYSNFWCGMTKNYYYRRTDDYKPILNGDKKGCFEVPMVHTAVLISLKTQQSDLLTYIPRKVDGYDGPNDDIITFAINCRNRGIKLNICNDHLYGFVQVPLEDGESVSDDKEQLLNVKLKAISAGSPLPLEPDMKEYVSYPPPGKYGVDEIYMINLERRPERRRLMELSFKELGMSVTLFKAIDGRELDMNNLRAHSIKLMPGYEDPYHKRPMKAGEVGCFLSHYFIWKKVVEKHHAVTLVLEDDIHFEPYFRRRLQQLLEELKPLQWDIVYIGRKILEEAEEEYVTAHTTRPRYSYWTLGYLISERGAERLLAAEPLARLLPVDEFLPIMFDQHPNSTWKDHFPSRQLWALSAAPLLVHPTHYTGQPGYLSDTEDSALLAKAGGSGLRSEL